MSIAVFVFGMNMTIRNGLLLKIIDLINKYSCGIFRIHILILILLRKMNIYWNLLHPFFFNSVNSNILFNCCLPNK